MRELARLFGNFHTHRTFGYGSRENSRKSARFHPILKVSDGATAGCKQIAGD